MENRNIVMKTNLLELFAKVCGDHEKVLVRWQVSSDTYFYQNIATIRKCREFLPRFDIIFWQVQELPLMHYHSWTLCIRIPNHSILIPTGVCKPSGEFPL